ncbi:hypothetical protein BH23PSE1_BH23PSE1_16260 [soil metagenome]
MAFIVVLHLAPDHESHLADLLRKPTRLPVRTVDEPHVIENDTVYFIPPNKTLVVGGGAATPHDRLNAGAHHPVDDLFASLARH